MPLFSHSSFFFGKKDVENFVARLKRQIVNGYDLFHFFDHLGAHTAGYLRHLMFHVVALHVYHVDIVLGNAVLFLLLVDEVIEHGVVLYEHTVIEKAVFQQKRAHRTDYAVERNIREQFGLFAHRNERLDEELKDYRKEYEYAA